jgi:hypothetical protein
MIAPPQGASFFQKGTFAGSDCLLVILKLPIVLCHRNPHNWGLSGAFLDCEWLISWGVRGSTQKVGKKATQKVENGVFSFKP